MKGQVLQLFYVSFCSPLDVEFQIASSVGHLRAFSACSYSWPLVMLLPYFYLPIIGFFGGLINLINLCQLGDRYTF